VLVERRPGRNHRPLRPTFADALDLLARPERRGEVVPPLGDPVEVAADEGHTVGA